MFPILGFLVVLVLHGAHAQFDCVPNHVGNISLDLNYVLHWTESTNCDPTHYLIYVHLEDDLQFIFNTEDNFLDVNFLPACERFTFLIRAFSNHILSEDSNLEAYMPAPSGANLTLNYLNATRQGRGLSLHWEVDEKFAHCARAFRVAIREDWNVRDVYTQNTNLFIDDLVPCAEYELTVTAIYNQQSEGPIKLLRYEVPADTTDPPVLHRLSAAATYVNATFGVANYNVNRCPILALRISGTFFSRTYDIQDSPQRPEVFLDVNPLQSDSMYYVGVFVINSAGSSEALPLGIQTLPLGS